MGMIIEQPHQAIDKIQSCDMWSAWHNVWPKARKHVSIISIRHMQIPVPIFRDIPSIVTI